MQPLRLLLIEDEERLAGNLRQGLTEEGIALDWVKSAEEAELILARHDYDLMVLDIGLPGKSGLEFLSERRKNDDSTPVLFLTARGSVDDRVTGLESGGDDYLVKPFAFVELLARIHALARRRRHHRPPDQKADRCSCVPPFATPSLPLPDRSTVP